ncbi:etoposide-induced protein 2.4-domain-containing protein [Mycena belliarum]|uniref:Etoposide-induced protein 2.4-domain-containing protein n=1 Tax=Mycena belliarum TaxID=1033014 RepID=A0AAD6XWN1_9AGAR|nr:etoposide-induced protein 2.4-domain-containing protein [Mycena belliae]
MALRYSHPGHAAGYPLFLPIHESLRLQLSYAGRGILDAFRWPFVATMIANDAEIRSNIYKSLLLNSFCLASLYVFDPLFYDSQQWFRPNVGWIYQLLWLLPAVGTSFYLNSSWCSVIAKRTYSLQHANRAVVQQPVTYTGVLTAIATSAYRVVMVFTSVTVSFVLVNIPRVGPATGFVFMCWIDSYYCFEFVWIARGLSLSGRIRHLEERWAYYFAFGLPSAVLCTWGSSLANAVSFALIFPLYIIMAMNARPVPDDPYGPLPDGSDHNGNDDVIRHPSPFVPIRLPIFAVVMWLNDAIVKAVSVGTGKGSGPASLRRNRAFSDGSESVEHGGLGHDRMKPPRPARGRINIGRRKID